MCYNDQKGLNVFVCTASVVEKEIHFSGRHTVILLVFYDLRHRFMENKTDVTYQVHFKHLKFKRFET